jgi:hypothetical protein
MRKLPAPVPCPPRPGGSGGVVVHFVRWLTTGALLAALVAGCGGESSPTPAPPASQSTSASSPTQAAQPAQTAQPTESATPPAEPAEVRGSSRAAAASFVRYYIQLINYAGTSGDVLQLRQYSSRKCVSCERLIELFEKTYHQGGYFHTHGWSPKSLLVAQLGSRRNWLADTEIAAAAVHWRASQTKPKKFVGSETLHYRLRIRYEGDRHWKMIEMTRS